MRTILALSLAFSTLCSAAVASAAITGAQAKGKIVPAVKASSKVHDKGGSFRTKLGGKASDTVRPFTATNLRMMMRPTGGPGFENQPLGGARVHLGGVASGTINMKTEKVKVTGYAQPRPAR
jgi:hypothetical protein